MEPERGTGVCMGNDRRSRPEILAPAGASARAVKGLIADGADAVYFGVRPARADKSRAELSGRPSAFDFDLVTARDVITRLHDAGRKSYVTINIPYGPDQLERALELAVRLHESGVSAVIAGDAGLVRRLQENCPACRVHVSIIGQTLNSGTAQFWRDLGAARVTLERTISIEEALAVKRACRLEVELFVYGAFCFQYHRFCSVSGYFYGQMCLGPCMDPARIECLPDAGIMPFRSKLLNAYDALPQIVRGQVDAIKIEGRQKSPRYIRAVVRAYRAAVDAIVGGEPLPIPPRSRFFTVPPQATPGFYLGDPDTATSVESSPGLRDRVRHLMPYLYPGGLRYAMRRKRLIIDAGRK